MISRLPHKGSLFSTYICNNAYTLYMKTCDLSKWWKAHLWLGVPVILFISALQHSLYTLLPFEVIGIWAPVNESLAEHLKIVFYPTLLWFLVTFAIFRKRCNLDFYKWITSGGIASIVAVSLLTALFCTFVYGFNVPFESFIFHIFIELVSITIAYILGLHYYNRTKGDFVITAVVIFLTIGVAVLMGVFAFYPPDIRIFKG